MTSCERCDCAGRPVASTAPRSDDDGAKLVIVAKGKTDLQLGVRRATLAPRGSGGDVLLRARVADGRGAEAWARALVVSFTLNTLEPGPIMPILQGAECRMRYLHAGLASEADLQPTRIEGELSKVEGDYVLSLRMSCEKRVEKTVRGSAHAPELPNEVEVSTEVRLLLPRH